MRSERFIIAGLCFTGVSFQISVLLGSREEHYGEEKDQKIDTCDLPPPEPALTEADGNFFQDSIKSGMICLVSG